MVQTQSDDWRNAHEALAYDITLLASIFGRLRNQHIKEGILDLDHFSKQQVIDAIEAYENKKLLCCRPNFRKLHTRLASLTNIQESISLEMFRNTRLRDKSITFDIAKELLQGLTQYQRDKEIEQLNRPSYKPMWCTRIPSCGLKRLAVTFNISYKPPNLLTMRECRLLELQAKWTRERVAVVAHCFIQGLFQTILAPNPPRTPIAHSEHVQSDERTATPLRTNLPARSKQTSTTSRKVSQHFKANETGREISLLKLQLLCPGLSDTLDLPTPVPENTEDAVRFLLAVESMGDSNLAKRIWSSSAVRSNMRAASRNSTENKCVAYLASFDTWWSQYRTKSIRVVSFTS